MPPKPAVFISVVGRPMSGKTGIMKLIIEVLKNHNIEVLANWGIDGEPQSVSPDFDKKRLASIANKTKVVINEIQARRARNPEDHAEDTTIEVVFDKEKGYGARLTVAGFPLESWFGNFSVSKERARTVASRLSAEFDVEIEDKIPREYDWVQPQ